METARVQNYDSVYNGNKKHFDIQIDTKELLKTLSFCLPIIEKKNVNPVLSNVKIKSNISNDSEAKNQFWLDITATDNNIFIHQRLPIKIHKRDIDLTLPLHTFSEIVRKIPDNELTISYNLEQHVAQIQSKGYLEFNLTSLTPEFFPNIEEVVDPSFTIKIEASKLTTLLERTKFSISTEETRYTLNGVFLHTDSENNLLAASTDGHRLSIASTQASIKIHDNNDRQLGVILPKKTVFELSRILKESSLNLHEVTIKITHNKIQFSCQDTILISKLIDGNFPQYETYIPMDNSKKLSIKAQYLAEIIDRVSTINTEKFRTIQLKINNDNIEVYAHGETKGEAKEILLKCPDTLTSSYYSNEDNKELFEYKAEAPLSIGFNPKYLLDVLDICGSENIELLFHDAVSPSVIKLMSNEVISTFVVMPINIMKK